MCKCDECRKNVNGYRLVNRHTFKKHEKKQKKMLAPVNYAEIFNFQNVEENEDELDSVVVDANNESVSISNFDTVKPMEIGVFTKIIVTFIKMINRKAKIIGGN
ncbi:uncharacterized protein BX663DRAFT_490887 [Cokeromyces recurvatus]|uniref:uncharacterized protein n=1 Tax=Cokeromyces recurvatus TaxID=90255 RepID=UPI002221009D|nr:uncharacterized protein BX663DRAFT_490887 [Cokeromyces recurvatus]KAI7897441.1 hypothetical protein BX663DRAFT_490887 [Cokeromyces recurvatus]